MTTTYFLSRRIGSALAMAPSRLAALRSAGAIDRGGSLMPLPAAAFIQLQLCRRRCHGADRPCDSQRFSSDCRFGVQLR